MRTIHHDTHPVPGQLHLRLPAGSVTIVASPETTQASVTLTPARTGDQTAVDAITQATVTQDENMLAVTVPQTGQSGAVTQTVVHRGNGDVFVSQRGGVVTGSMTGVTIIRDGQVIVGSGSTTMISGPGGSGVRADLRVPAGQHVEIDTTSADVTATGPLATLRATTGSGDVRIEQASNADLRTGSGDIMLGRVGSVRARTRTGDVRADQLRTGDVRTGSGDVTVRVITGPLTLTTGSGDVRAHLSADVPLKATTGNGDIRATAEPGIRIDRSGLRTGAGDIRTH